MPNDGAGEFAGQVAVVTGAAHRPDMQAPRDDRQFEQRFSRGCARTRVQFSLPLLHGNDQAYPNIKFCRADQPV